MSGREALYRVRLEPGFVKADSHKKELRGGCMSGQGWSYRTLHSGVLGRHVKSSAFGRVLEYVSLRGIKKTAHEGGFSRWRWARDSNPGNLSVQRFSRPPLSTTQPAHLNLYRRPSKEAPHYSDASLTIKLPARYFLRKMHPSVRRSLSGLVDR